MKQKLIALLHRPAQRGQSLVELAISLTVMLLLLSGAVTFGMALFSFVSIRDAAGEGALYGSITPYEDLSPTGYNNGDPVNWQKICDRVKAATTSPVNLNSFTCTHDGAASHANNNIDVVAIDKPCEGPSTGGGANAVKVMIDYYYPIIMPYIGGIVGSQTIHLRASVTDTILSPRCP